MKTEKPSLRSTELSRIHAQRQSAVIATVLQEFPDPIPKHCAKLLSYAPESFDDLRYGAIAAAAWSLHLNQKPVTLYTVQEQLARSPAKADLSDIFRFMSLSPMALPPVLLDIECEELWLAYSHRRQATLMHEASEAITANPSMADDISRRVSREIEAMIASTRNGDSLPEIICCRSLLSTELELPALLIEGLLHQGSKLSLGGGSKTFKSWTFLSMAVAVSTGTPWLGFATTRGKVLIVNFEIADCWMRYRVHTVCQAANLWPESGWLDIWNLRGHSAPHSTVIPKIIARAKDLGYAMVIIDPSYKLIGQGDENSASDVGAMMSSFEQITVQTKAAVLFGAHFAKGNASAKEAIDRISGSGVFARDPDSILTFTPHEQPDCFTVEATLRNLPHLNPFVVRWNFPSFERAEDLDPGDLKKKVGRPADHKSDDLLSLLDDHPLSLRDWMKSAYDTQNTSRATFFRLKSDLETRNLVLKSKINGLYTRVSKTPRASDTDLNP